MKKLGLIIIISMLAFMFTSEMVKATPWGVGDAVTISLSTPVLTDPNNVFGSSITNGYGGLFTVTNTTSGGSINTFCMELDEFVSTSNTYYISDISDDIVMGGGRNILDNSGDQISDATKWLYVQYIDGNPSYQNTQALQLAFWVLEGEYWDKTIDDIFWGYWNNVGSVAKSYYGLAQGKSTTADIRALDLVGSTGKPVQSYIVRVPEPSTLLLLGAGLLGLGLVARRRKK